MDALKKSIDLNEYFFVYFSDIESRALSNRAMRLL